jgi:pimeloyl-ACP methyl ester carboxylesterase
VVSLDWHHDIASVLDENEKLKRRTERQTAIIRLLVVLLKLSGFRLDEQRPPDGTAKAKGSTSKSTTPKCPIALLSDRPPTRSTLTKPIVSATASRPPGVRLIGQEWRQTEVSHVACADHHPLKNPGVSSIEEGEGTPLVLVHGIPTSSFLWRDMIGELSAHGRVIAPDLPGFGHSDPPPNGDYSISSYARLLESFLEALSIGGATLICHDFGGPVTVTYALRNPEKYQRLIILDTFLHTDLPDWGLFYKIARTRPIGEILMGLGGKWIARSGLEAGVVNKSRISEETVQRYYMPDGSPDKLNETYLGTLRVDNLDDLEFIEKNLTTINKPTLIVWGENDAYLPLSLADRIHKDIAGSKMEIIPDCGHFVQEDEPEKVTELIVSFLND